MIINNKTIKAANENFLDLTEMAYLYSLHYNLNWELNVTPASIHKLNRMGFLNNDIPTIAAENILLECIDKAPVIEAPKSDEFEILWKMFPRDDEFRHFSKTRMIRWNKAETNKWYNEARLKYSHEQLQSALERELAYRNTSVKENLFKYMKGSVNWFKEEAFLNFLEMEDIKYDNTYGKDIGD